MGYSCILRLIDGVVELSSPEPAFSAEAMADMGSPVEVLLSGSAVVECLGVLLETL